ncbi:MAG: hypothetical protein IT475_11790 [Aquimonas sp.]|jgi:hypothetical protein|nr:hypothetical protein [Aquimonas sp.]
MTSPSEIDTSSAFFIGVIRAFFSGGLRGSHKTQRTPSGQAIPSEHLT